MSIQARLWPGFDTPIVEVRNVLNLMRNTTVEAVQVNGGDSELFRGVLRETYVGAAAYLDSTMHASLGDRGRGLVLTVDLWNTGEQQPFRVKHHDRPGPDLYVSSFRNDVSQIDPASVYPFDLIVPDGWPGPGRWVVDDESSEPDWTDRDWVQSQFEVHLEAMLANERAFEDYPNEDDEVEDDIYDPDPPRRSVTGSTAHRSGHVNSWDTTVRPAPMPRNYRLDPSARIDPIRFDVDLPGTPD